MTRLLLFFPLAFVDIATCFATIMMPVAVRGPMVIADGKLYFVQEPGSLTVLDLRDGKVLGRHRFDSDVGGELVPTAHNVAVTGYSHVYLIAPESGRVLFESVAVMSRANEGRVAILDAEKRIVLVNRETIESTVHEIGLTEEERVVDFGIDDERLILVIRDSVVHTEHVVVYDTQSRQIVSQRALARNVAHYLTDDALFVISRREPEPDMDTFEMIDDVAPLTVNDFVYTVAPLEAIDQVQEKTAIHIQRRLSSDPEYVQPFDGTSVVVDGVFLGWHSRRAIKLPREYQKQLTQLLDSVDNSIIGQWIAITRSGPFVSTPPSGQSKSFTTLRSPNGWRRAFPKNNASVSPHIVHVICDEMSNSVVVDTGDGRIECLNLDSGEPRWLYTFAYSWGMVSTHGGYVGPYLDHEEARHQKRVAESRLLTGSFPIEQDVSLKNFAAHPFPDGDPSVKVVRDPLPDVLYPQRIDRVRRVRMMLIAIVVAVIALAVLSGIAAYRSESEIDRLKIIFMLCFFFAVGFYLVATLLWNHHRVDSSLTMQMKLACGQMGVGIAGLSLHAAWRKRILASLGMAVTLGVLLFVHWRPIVYP